MTGAGKTLSGTGTFIDIKRIQIDANITIPAGSNLNLTLQSEIRVGNNNPATLTINGTITGTSQANGNRIIRVDNNNAAGVIINGAINAPNSFVEIQSGAAAPNNGLVTNNGTVTLQYLDGNNDASSTWTQGVNSNLTLSQPAQGWIGTFNASATGNTVTYNSPATPLTPSGNTYYNLAGSGVTCPHGFTVPGSDPCAPPAGTTTVTASPTACTNVTGIGTQAWGTLTGPLASDNAYATASVNDNQTTNYLQCTGYGFAIPAGATINGITVNVERRTSGNPVRDAAMRLVRAGAIETTDRSTATNYTTADVIEAHGGMADLWGASWTAADINNASFGAALASIKAGTAGGARTVRVDHMSISVNYSLAFPTVLSINRASADPTSPATSVDWTVTFSESVTGVDAADFALVMGGGVTGAAITGVTGSGTTWTVTAYTGAGAGTLGLNLADNDTIIDAALAPLGGAGAGNGNFTGQVYTVQSTTSGFIFTNSPCVHNIAFGAPGQTCVLISWSPQIAGQNLTGIYITRVNTSGVPTRLHPTQNRTRNMEFGLSCHDPVANAGIHATFAGATLPLCQANGAIPAAWSSTVTVTFPGGSPSSNISYTFNYADVGRVELWMRNNANPTETGNSGAFVVKPAGFVLSNIKCATADAANCGAGALAMPTPGDNPGAANAAGVTFIRAGHPFTVTVTAKNALGGITANYGQETTAESVKLTSALVTGLGLTNNPSIGGTLGAFSNGIATGTAFTWNEVGIITLTPSVGDGDYLGAGNVTGSTSSNIGRFYAAKFALSGGVIANRTGLGGICAVAGCDTFTYMGEQMSAMFTLTAQAVDGTTTLQNYNYSATAANNFAKLDPTATGNPLALAAVDTGTPRTVAALDTTTYGVASGSFAGGIASVTASFMVTRGGSASGPFGALDVGVNPADSDGAALATLDLAVNAGGTPNTHGKVGTTKARYGRMKLSNAHGSELLNLSVPMEAQYWQGQYWAQNSLDDATTIIQDNIRLATISGPAVTISGVIKDAAGKWRIVLNKPLARASSNVCLDLDVGATGDMTCVATATPLSMPYLQTGAAFDKDPTSRATFGVYKGNNEFIYLREIY
jgi:MSHA biogenesis protein MshQ